LSHVKKNSNTGIGTAVEVQNSIKFYLDVTHNAGKLEQVEVKPGRVAIHEMIADDETGSQITGGYLLEIDQPHDADRYFHTNHNLPFSSKSPDEITDKQLAYINNYVQQTEDAIFSDNFADPKEGYANILT
jgi:hypothetical protein